MHPARFSLKWLVKLHPTYFTKVNASHLMYQYYEHFLQILICQNLRNNLQHPNEYIRGVTLRFLCRIREEEIFEPLIPSILTCLEHRHSYVRRNAVLAINAIYKLPKGEIHLQDAPELIEKVLTTEQDLSTKRNAFQMLCNHAQDRAVHYLLEQIDNVAHWGDILQMAVLELIRKVRVERAFWPLTGLAINIETCCTQDCHFLVLRRYTLALHYATGKSAVKASADST